MHQSQDKQNHPGLSAQEGLRHNQENRGNSKDVQLRLDVEQGGVEGEQPEEEEIVSEAVARADDLFEVGLTTLALERKGIIMRWSER